MSTVTDNKKILENAANLLQGSTGIIRIYDEKYRKAGLKYNVFKIARIKEKEVIMCRVIADLLNSKGSHYKGDLYLKLFWDIVSPKIENAPKLDTPNVNATTEYSIDAQRRIDIALEDGTVFIPIEVKIYAGEQSNQVKDYAEYAKKRNKGKNVPVLYLTLEGGESETAGGNEYTRISFSKDILQWLSLCLKQEETEKTPPVREIIKQFMEAIKTICGYSEDDKMNREISELIMQSEETIRAAMEINNALEAIDDEKWNIFKGVICDKVKERIPDTDICDGVEDWYAISVPVKKGAYTLYVNYDWASITVESDGKEMSPSVEKSINKVMTALTGVSDAETDGEWRAEGNVSYPGMEHTEEALYPYLLYKRYKENPQEASDYIIAMANELEKI
jgi:hypothetical protein